MWLRSWTESTVGISWTADCIYYHLLESWRSGGFEQHCRSKTLARRHKIDIVVIWFDLYVHLLYWICRVCVSSWVQSWAVVTSSCCGNEALSSEWYWNYIRTIVGWRRGHRAWDGPLMNYASGFFHHPQTFFSVTWLGIFVGLCIEWMIGTTSSGQNWALHRLHRM